MGLSEADGGLHGGPSISPLCCLVSVDWEAGWEEYWPEWGD